MDTFWLDLYMTPGKTIALTRQTLVGKVMSLLLNIPSYLDLNITIREGDGTSSPVPLPGKSIALTRKTFVGKVMSLLFNMLSRL